MKISVILKEIVEPRKPSNVKSSRFKKSGVQGSYDIVKQRQFTTSKGNDVKVQFTVKRDSDDESSVDVNFYVNDTHYDDSSTQGGKNKNDFEILSGVLYLTKSFVDRGKHDRITFIAQKGDGDTKTIRGRDPSTYAEAVRSSLSDFKQDIISYKPTQQEIDAEDARVASLNKKFGEFGKKFSSKIVYTDELLEIIEKIKQFISGGDTDLKYQIIAGLQKYDKTVKNFESYKKLVNNFNALLDAHESNTDQGLTVHSNRRASLYRRLVNKYFSNEWTVTQYGDSFELVRK